MPELPEVETIKRDLEKKILKKKIIRIRIKDKKIGQSGLERVKGKYFLDIDRIGKLLIFKLSEKGYFMLVHLKMTGQLVYAFKKFLVAGGHSLSSRSDMAAVGGKLPNKHTRAIFEFKDGGRLFFNDLRRFGYIKMVNKSELNLLKESFGIEPLKTDFIYRNILKIFKNRKTSLKAVLLNQKLISGIGNIYADEILFRAGLRPDRVAGSLKPTEIKKLYRATNYIIRRAIKYRGTTFSDYVDAKGRRGNFSTQLKVYGRSGKKCYKCSNVIKKIRIAGRGTSFCPKCQK